MSDRRDAGRADPGAAQGSRSLVIRLSIAPLIAALAFVTIYGAAGIGRESNPRIHSLRNASACGECHPEDDAKRLADREPSLCLRCHEGAMDHGYSHPMFMKVETCLDPELWLQDGEMTCSTCHDPHGRTTLPGLMRRSGNDRCLPCHPDKGGSH